MSALGTMILGVTYELLSDAHFIEVATKGIPTFAKLHREFDAVKVVRASGNALP